VRSLLVLFALATAASLMPPTTLAGLEGTEFRFGIIQNFRTSFRDKSDVQAKHVMVLTVSASGDAIVKITAGGDVLPPVKVAAGSVQHVAIPESAVALIKDSVSNASVHVTSDVPVRLHYFDSRFQTTEAMSILPVEFYGMDYVLASYTPLAADLVPSAIVVATQNATTVTVNSNDKVKWTATYTLNAGQSVRIDGRHESTPVDPTRTQPGEIDLTGFTITADKPVSVSTGHLCSYVPAKTEACNVLMEHLPPRDLMGRKYVVPMIPNRKFEQLRVIPLRDDVTFRVAGLAYKAAKGNYKEITIEGGPFELTADGDVMVAIYTPGFRAGDSIGDPSLLILPPLAAWETECTVLSNDISTWKPTVTVVGSADIITSLSVNGKGLPNVSSVHAMDGYMQLDLPVENEYMRLISTLPMLVIVSSQTASENAYDGYATYCTWKR